MVAEPAPGLVIPGHLTSADFATYQCTLVVVVRCRLPLLTLLKNVTVILSEANAVTIVPVGSRKMRKSRPRPGSDGRKRSGQSGVEVVSSGGLHRRLLQRMGATARVVRGLMLGRIRGRPRAIPGAAGGAMALDEMTTDPNKEAATRSTFRSSMGRTTERETGYGPAAISGRWRPGAVSLGFGRASRP